MQGLNPLVIVSKAFDGFSLSLDRPSAPITFKSQDEAREAYVRWGITYYVYAVIAHVRTLLRGLIVLSDSGNIPTMMVVCRHLFEWVAHVCYMNDTLQQHLAVRDWDNARKLLDQAVLGSRWIKEHGHKYGPVHIPVDIPNSIRLNKVLACYEAHVEKTFGGDTKDDYAHLSEHSHPNSACFLQYLDDLPGPVIRFKEPTKGSPLPVVNWCLIDLNSLLLELLILSDEQTVRPTIVATLKEIARLASGKRRS